MSHIRTAPSDISVTLDFLMTIPNVDLSSESGLRVALTQLGFDVEKDEEGNTPKAEIFHNVLVRYRDAPYLYRETTVYSGKMRRNFHSEEHRTAIMKLFANVNILDVASPSKSSAKTVSDLPYELPVQEKANTRKYTKRKDAPAFMEMSPAPEDFDTDGLNETFGE